MGRYTESLTRVKPRKTLAVTLDRAKTAALAFDHVYGPSEAKIPGDIGPGFAWYPHPQAKKDPFIRVRMTRTDGSSNPEAMAVASTQTTLQHHLQHQKDQLFAALRSEGLHAVEFLETHSQTYERGDDRYIFAVLEGVVGVSESDLQWDQVKEFRRDPESLRAYRSMLHWFNDQCLGMEQREAEHHLCTTYELALERLRKHGIVLGTGSVAIVMGGGAALAAALASGVGLAGALMAGLATSVAGHKLTAKLCDEYLRRKERQLVGPLAYLQRYEPLGKTPSDQ